MSQVKITVRPNGPLRIDDPNGLVELVDADGRVFTLPVRGERKPSLLRRRT